MPELNGYHKYVDVTGGGLLDRIVANERVPEARIAFFMRQLLQALNHMHKKNVVHLDLKPENIMLSENGSNQIKLTDFGLSRRLRRDKPTYGVLGAPEFVSPEVVAQKPVSLATDMWSVGVLAYVMLSGKSPFLGDSDTETLANVANARWNFDPKFFEPVSPEAKDFISKLLVLDPKKRLDVHDALGHPWVQLADTKGEGELLTTQFLKEFKYRHQWVERRIFVQYGNDDEDARARLFTDNLEWLEPTYFPLPPSATPERAQIEATLPLPSARLTQRPSPAVQTGTALFPETAQVHELQAPGKPSAKRGKEEPRRRRGDGADSLDEIPDFDVYVSRGERRPIEDELASRILSDISEEGSMISEEVASKASSRPFSMESLIEDRLGEGDAAEYERNTTPTQDDYPTSTVIKLAPGKMAQMVVQVDEGAPLEKPPMKSPVRLSPTKEEVMECIVAAKKSDSQKTPPVKDTGVDPKALLPLQRSAKLADHEFEQLMANAERVKEGIRQRLREGKPPSKEAPVRDMNGHDRQRGPARPLTDFDVPYPAYELDDFDWDSQYQMGPDTFLLQLRDAGMATRVRDYRRHLYGDSASYVVNGWLGDINNDISLRERRRYTDLIKNNKDLKEAAHEADRSTEAARVGAIKRFRGIQSTLVPAPMISGADGTHSPIFQSRLKDTMFAEDSQATFQCTVLANPPAEIVWYHNEAPIMIEAGVTRHTMTYENNKAVLVIKPALAMDAGTYKCVAKNSLGESFSEAKLRMGDAPDRTSRPDVELASDTEVFITWEAPTPRSGSDIVGYKLEFRRAEEWTCPWFVVSDNLDEEAVVVRKLEPLGIYQFKVTPRNTYGWGEASLASRIIQTHARGAPKLNIELLKRDYHLNLVNLPQSGTLGEIPEEGGSLEGSPSPSERRDQATKSSLDLNTKDDPKARFQLESEMFRGRFCLIRNAVDKQSENAAHCVAKVLMANLELRRQAMKEYEALREIQHEHVVTLLSAYLREDFLILFLEKLSDNLIERFTYHDYYTEEHVARVMSQLLSALQWIHFKKICHLDLQPDNIMFTSKRSWNVKLLDTGTAVRLDMEKGESKVERLGAPEYAAPEVLHTGLVTPAADIWGIGLLSYLLLSGTHPFMTDDPRSQEEVVRNIVREKLDLNFVYTNASQEALRFMTWALKKQPGNRMNTEEGLQHRWLSFHETMIRRRENIKFSANRLRTFARTYFQIRKMAATNNNQLIATYGGGGEPTGVKRSASFGK